RPQRGSHQAIFEKIFRERSWGSDESRSGPGSTRDRAAAFVPDLLALLKRLEIRTLLDAPCGDFNWAKPIADAVDAYTGVDVVPELIDANGQSAAGTALRFLCADLTRDPLPRADLILCRDCLVHFSFADIRAAIRNFRRSDATYLLTTTFADPDRRNEDIDSGGWRPLNLERPPFDFPTPLATVDERCEHTGGIYRDKRLALWSLQSLQSSVNDFAR
ncbi:MAG: class I SAM-dependent methyltransferase, partial [Thermoanaerobaculia bacterium]